MRKMRKMGEGRGDEKLNLLIFTGYSMTKTKKTL
jgi:hypothetical protein